MNLTDATKTAELFKDLLAPACSRIEIVGSVKRRDKPVVHDIELLMILNGYVPRPEFGKTKIYMTKLEKILDELQQACVIRPAQRKANGDRYKKYAIVAHSQLNEFCLDLFIVREDTWGLQNVIRTGPYLFSHCFVTNVGYTFFHEPTGKHYQGLLPLQYRYVRGETRITLDGETLDLPEERDAIDLLGHGWIEPCRRREFIKVAVS